MLKNYFTIAGPNMVKHKSYTLINLVGLAFGICTCIVIFLVTDYKLSVDRFNSDGDRGYHIEGAMKNSSGELEFLNTSTSDMAAFIKDDESYRRWVAF